jgi:cytochrome o ubiquinol oxidase subunit 3
MSHAAAGAIDHHHDPSTTTGIPNKKLLMWAFLASDCMFFGSLIATHLIYRLNPIPGNTDATKIFDIELTSFSTFILLISSLMMALAVAAIQRGDLKSMRRCLLTTIFFGLIFLECQVYEFNHFVHVGGLTLSSTIFGSTFFVLTGTHGCHVAVGVLWLALMYVRSFQRRDGSGFERTVLHLLVFVAAVILNMYIVLQFAHSWQETEGVGAATGHFLGHHPLSTIGAFASLAVLYLLGRSKGPVNFDERNAIDVESMGLYWHFVDIVWIVIFTAVDLIEYVSVL